MNDSLFQFKISFRLFSPGRPRIRASAGAVRGHYETQHRRVRERTGEIIRLKNQNIRFARTALGSRPASLSMMTVSNY